MDMEHARDTRYAAKALELLDEYAELDQPWFIQFDFDGPHPLCKVPDPFFERHNISDAIVPANFHDSLADKPLIHTNHRIAQGTHEWSEEDWQVCNAVYYDMVSFLDSLVGRVLNRLEEHGQAENTIVILTSDHGGMCGSHGILMHGTPAMYTEVMRVPLVVRAPARCLPGTEVDALTSHVDLLPTIIELAGGELSTESHGRSWAGMLDGDPPSDWRDAVSGQYHGNGVLGYSARLLRTKDWSYLWHITGEEELYDLENDPLELENLAEKLEGEPLLKIARRRFNEFMQETDDPLEQQGLWRILQA
jgi:arylsulfatase A-like enzyme